MTGSEDKGEQNQIISDHVLAQLLSTLAAVPIGAQELTKLNEVLREFVQTQEISAKQLNDYLENKKEDISILNNLDLLKLSTQFIENYLLINNKIKEITQMLNTLEHLDDELLEQKILEFEADAPGALSCYKKAAAYIKKGIEQTIKTLGVAKGGADVIFFLGIATGGKEAKYWLMAQLALGVCISLYKQDYKPKQHKEGDVSHALRFAAATTRALTSVMSNMFLIGSYLGASTRLTGLIQELHGGGLCAKMNEEFAVFSKLINENAALWLAACLGSMLALIVADKVLNCLEQSKLNIELTPDDITLELLKSFRLTASLLSEEVTPEENEQKLLTVKKSFEQLYDSFSKVKDQKGIPELKIELERIKRLLPDTVSADADVEKLKKAQGVFEQFETQSGFKDFSLFLKLFAEDASVYAEKRLLGRDLDSTLIDVAAEDSDSVGEQDSLISTPNEQQEKWFLQFLVKSFNVMKEYAIEPIAAATGGAQTIYSLGYAQEGTISPAKIFILAQVAVAACLSLNDIRKAIKECSAPKDGADLLKGVKKVSGLMMGVLYNMFTISAYTSAVNKVVGLSCLAAEQEDFFWSKILEGLADIGIELNKDATEVLKFTWILLSAAMVDLGLKKLTQETPMTQQELNQSIAEGIAGVIQMLSLPSESCQELLSDPNIQKIRDSLSKLPSLSKEELKAERKKIFELASELKEKVKHQVDLNKDPEPQSEDKKQMSELETDLLNMHGEVRGSPRELSEEEIRVLKNYHGDEKIAGLPAEDPPAAYGDDFHLVSPTTISGAADAAPPPLLSPRHERSFLRERPATPLAVLSDAASGFLAKRSDGARSAGASLVSCQSDRADLRSPLLEARVALEEACDASNAALDVCSCNSNLGAQSPSSR